MISDKMNIAYPLVDSSSNLMETSRMFSDILPFGFGTGNANFDDFREADFDDFGNTNFDDFGAIKNPFAPPINNGINSKNKRRQKKQKYRQDNFDIINFCPFYSSC
jgi:hypothetical protein